MFRQESLINYKTMEVNEDVASMLLLRREALNLSTKTLGALAGIHFQTILNIERGLQTPTPWTALALEEALAHEEYKRALFHKRVYDIRWERERKSCP